MIDASELTCLKYPEMLHTPGLAASRLVLLEEISRIMNEIERTRSCELSPCSRCFCHLNHAPECELEEIRGVVHSHVLASRRDDLSNPKEKP